MKPGLMVHFFVVPSVPSEQWYTSKYENGHIVKQIRMRNPAIKKGVLANA